MTENEAIKEIERGMVHQEEIDGEAIEIAIQALEEIQAYRAIETELREQYHANVDIKMLMQHFIETIFKGEKHEGFCILTNEDAKMWEAYNAIGSADEFKALKEKSVAKKPDYEGDGCWDGHVVIDTWICPNCEKHYEVDYDDYDYCPNCGQYIDHSGLTEDD